MLPTQPEPAGAKPTRPWPADRVERWSIERLIPYANDARLHSEADLNKPAASIRKWGWTNPVLVDEEGNLLAGHGRCCRRSESAGDVQVIGARELGFRQLRNELQELGFADFDVGLIGVELRQIETVLTGLGSSGLTDPDSVPEVPDQPVTWLGDIWMLGDHRVGCGDSTNAAEAGWSLT